jgi:hypothetical protein
MTARREGERKREKVGKAEKDSGLELRLNERGKGREKVIKVEREYLRGT